MKQRKKFFKINRREKKENGLYIARQPGCILRITPSVIQTFFYPNIKICKKYAATRSREKKKRD